MLESMLSSMLSVLDAPSTVLKTSPGTYSIVVPSTTTMNLIFIGGGGSGASYGSYSGAAGNGGNYLKINRIVVDAGTYQLTVGAGGAYPYNQVKDTKITIKSSGVSLNLVCLGGSDGPSQSSYVYMPAYSQPAYTGPYPSGASVTHRTGGIGGGGTAGTFDLAGGGGAASASSNGGVGYGTKNGQPERYQPTGNGGGSGARGGSTQLLPNIPNLFGGGGQAVTTYPTAGVGAGGGAIISFGKEYEFI